MTWRKLVPRIISSAHKDYLFHVNFNISYHWLFPQCAPPFTVVSFVYRNGLM